MKFEAVINNIIKFINLNNLHLVKKIFYLLISVLIFVSCSSSDRGELIGVKGKKFYPDKPTGMVLIPSGSFLMGMSDDDVVGLQNAPVSTVSVKAFYMDETEITNGEYRQFVNWVKDSIVRQALAVRALEEIGETPTLEELDKDNSINSFFPIYQPTSEISDEDKSGYELYKEQNSFGINPYDKKTFNLNFDIDIAWQRDEYPDLAYAEVMEGVIEGTGFYLPKEESYNSDRIFDTKQIVYNYTTFDAEAAIKSDSESRKEFFKEKSIIIYPDTTSWIKDFSYSYNEPMHNDYFWHDAYSEYPVVGVSWEQAKAFAHWRTMYKNKYQKSKSKNDQRVASFRLPSEAEWEYAARGGIESGTYPWGGPYTTDAEGCFLANFKPNRGDYAADEALYTVEAKSFFPNDYGLYNMSGNVSEWTQSSYDMGSYTFDSGLNPNISDSTNLRKVIRGGSWKDVAYFLRVSTRDYEYKDEQRSYIGFRTVQDYIDENKVTKNNKLKIF